MNDNDQQTYQCRKCGKPCGLRICAKCLLKELAEVQAELAQNRGNKK